MLTDLVLKRLHPDYKVVGGEVSWGEVTFIDSFFLSHVADISTFFLQQLTEDDDLSPAIAATKALMVSLRLDDSTTLQELIGIQYYFCIGLQYSITLDGVISCTLMSQFEVFTA